MIWTTDFFSPSFLLFPRCKNKLNTLKVPKVFIAACSVDIKLEFQVFFTSFE